LNTKLALAAPLALAVVALAASGIMASWGDEARISGTLSIGDWEPSIRAYIHSCGCTQARVEEVDPPLVVISYGQGYTGHICMAIIVDADTTVPIGVQGASLLEGGSLEWARVYGPFEEPPPPTCPHRGGGPVILPPGWHAVVWVKINADGSGHAIVRVDYGIAS